MIDKIKESIPSLLLSGILAILGFAFGAIYSEITPIFLQTILQPISKLLLLKLFFAATLIVFLLFVLSCYFYLKSRTKLIPKCGVLWSKEKDPYCPACQIPMSEYSIHNSSPNDIYQMSCKKCGAYIRLMHNGKNISLEDAQKLLNS